MSLFETLKKAIFHNPLARQTSTQAAPSATAKPAVAAKPASATNPSSAAGPAGATKSAASPAPTPSAAPPPPAARATPPPQQSVDVEQVLEGLNAQSAQKLNWRTSIVDLMKLVGLDSSLQNRKSLATELGYTGDTNDSAAMNIWLHKAVMKKLAENGGKVPASLQ